MTEEPPKSVAARVLSILDTFDAEHLELSLSDIARRCGLPVATCYRLVRELVAWGGLVKMDGHYRIGHKLWALGLLSPTQQGLAELASPFMHDVLFLTKHVVNLFIREGREALLLERISGTKPGPAVRRVGDRMPLHASAAGKVFLAHAGPELVEEVLADLEPLTAATVTDPRALRRELDRVKAEGYAVTSEEAAMGAHGVAVPITVPGGRVVASLGVVVIGARPRPSAIVPVLQVAARGIARQVTRTSGYGYRE